MTAEKLDNLTKRFASEVAEFENKHKVINGGFVTGLFRKYLIEADKEAYNQGIIDANEKAATVLKDVMNGELILEDIGILNLIK
jgi:hypothetical protein